MNQLKLIFLFFLSLALTSCNNSIIVNADIPPKTFSVTMDSNDGGVAAGQTEVSLHPIIMLSFSDKMNSDTINTDNIYLESNAAVKISRIIPVDRRNNNLFLILPRESLTVNTNYNVVITDKVRSRLGHTGAVNFSFKTVEKPENSKPSVAILEPLNNVTDVKLSTKVKLVFNPAIVNFESNIHVYNKDNISQEITNIKDFLNIGYVFNFKNQLAPSERYTIVIESTIMDKYGESLAQNKEFSFFTSDDKLPNVDFIYPGDNESNVALSTPIIIQFNVPAVNVNSDNIKLCIGSDCSTSITLPEKFPRNLYKFTPTVDLLSNTTYTLLIESGITDKHDIPIKSESYIFVTRAR